MASTDMAVYVDFDMGTTGGDLAGEVGHDMATTVNPDLAGSPTVNLTGTFATKIVNNQIFSSSLNGDGPVTITTLFMTNATQNGTTLGTQATTCDVQLTPYKGKAVTVATTYPPAAIKAIHPQANMINLGTAVVGGPYTFESVQNIGWKPAGDPKTTPLPTKDTDAQVTDDDMDSHPGVSLQVMVTGLIKATGNVYACNRSIVDVDAKIVSSDKVAGKSTTNQQQQVLGADNQLLAGQQVSSKPDTTKGSTFTMVRLTAAQANCQYIVANQGKLFP